MSFWPSWCIEISSLQASGALCALSITIGELGSRCLCHLCTEREPATKSVEKCRLNAIAPLLTMFFLMHLGHDSVSLHSCAGVEGRMEPGSPEALRFPRTLQHFLPGKQGDRGTPKADSTLL